jgi:PadR family transcriptional regulator PadR
MQLWITQFRKGLVELSVMAALAGEEAYGYQVVERLGQVEGLELTESTVYPLLARLAREGLLDVRTAPSPAGPPRRYYRLTPNGMRRLGEMVRHWTTVRDSVDKLLEGRTS